MKSIKIHGYNEIKISVTNLTSNFCFGYNDVVAIKTNIFLLAVVQRDLISEFVYWMVLDRKEQNKRKQIFFFFIKPSSLIEVLDVNFK